ncbi:MAG: hypothetical protein NTZ17_21045 [Phycisphaerae bacterium]|nr:hypothetical protein [Phycisphaerae bacterium]
MCRRKKHGRAVVAQNAVKHGLLAKEVVIKGEDPGEFEFYRDQMLGESAPVGQMESMPAARVVSLSWRLRRAERLQGAAFDAMHEKLVAEPVIKLPALLGFKPADRPAGEPGREDAELTLGRVVVRDYSNARVLDRLLMYERRIESSLYRTMGELRKQRRLREAEPSAAGATAEGGVARSTGILPVSSMGVPPMKAKDIPGQVCPEPGERDACDTHGRDGRATHGRDAHATRPPEGGTPNGANA